jgi:hypothetical protein
MVWGWQAQKAAAEWFKEIEEGLVQATGGDPVLEGPLNAARPSWAASRMAGAGV